MDSPALASSELTASSHADARHFSSIMPEPDVPAPQAASLCVALSSVTLQQAPKLSLRLGQGAFPLISSLPSGLSVSLLCPGSAVPGLLEKSPLCGELSVAPAKARAPGWLISPA